MKARQTGGWKLEDLGFAALVLVVTIAFLLLMAPYSGAILWGMVAAIVFGPVQRRIVMRTGGREGLAATLTLLLILALVIVPAILLGVSLVQEAAAIYSELQTGRLDLASIIAKFRSSLPRPVSLAEIKEDKKLAQMSLVRFSRLSVQPVTAAEWAHICKLGGLKK